MNEAHRVHEYVHARYTPAKIFNCCLIVDVQLLGLNCLVRRAKRTQFLRIDINRDHARTLLRKG